jgi:hypothetical protein
MDPTLDALLKIAASFVPLLSGVVAALWKALNTAWEKNQLLQTAGQARSDAQQERCRACNEKWQAEYKTLITENVEVIRQNTAAQETQVRFSELMKELKDSRVRATKAGG